MKSQSLTIGTFFGIQLRIHYSWLIIFALVAWSVITGYLPAYRQGLSLQVKIVAGLAVTILFFASVICHEYAHALTAKTQGLKVKVLRFFCLAEPPNFSKNPPPWRPTPGCRGSGGGPWPPPLRSCWPIPVPRRPRSRHGRTVRDGGRAAFPRRRT